MLDWRQFGCGSGCYHWKTFRSCWGQCGCKKCASILNRCRQPSQID